MNWALAALCLCLPVTIAGANISAALLSATLLLCSLDGKRHLPFDGALTGPFYALLFYCAIGAAAAFFGQDPGRSLHEVQKDFHKLWIFTILTVSLASSPRPGLDGFLGTGFAIAASIGIGQSLFLHEEGKLWLRAHAFVHPVTFGEQMALACLGSLCVFSGAPSGARKRAAVFMALLTGLALLFSQTRAALAALVVGVVALCGLDSQWRRRARWLWAAAAAGLLILALLPTQRPWSELLDGFDASGKINPQRTRLVLWDVAVRILFDHPVLGVGPGHYGSVFSDYFKGTLDNQAVWTSAHNLFLHQAAERGLLGLIALLVVAAAFTLRAFDRAKSRPSPANLWAFTALAAFGVMCLTEVAFQNEQVSTLLIFLWVWAETNHSPAPTGEV